MAYERINWQNEPSEATAVNNVNLNKMDSAIYDHDTRLDTDEASLANKVDKVTGQGLSKTNDVQVTSSTNVGTEIATVQIFPSTGGVSGVQIKNGVVVDSALSSSSENPVQNKVVKSAIDGKSTVAISDTLATGTTLANITIDGTTTAIKGSDIEVDEELSPTSTNPVENKAIYDALNNLLPSKTVSGNPIAISDASGFDAKALTVSMNPIQDLHGQSAPYPAGGGKNKSSVNSVDGVAWAVTNADLKNVFNSLQNGTYTISFSIKVKTVTSTGEWIYGFMAQNPNGNISKMNTVTTDATVGDEGSIVYTFTITDSNRDAFTSFNLYGCGAWVGGAKGTADFSNIQIELGNQATDFAPYSNICPISGRTEASVTRTAGEDVETKTHQYSETIYGGVDDFVNGELVVDRIELDLGSLTWSVSTGHRFQANLPNNAYAKASGSYATESGEICENYPTLTQNDLFANNMGIALQGAGGNAGKLIFLYDENYSDAQVLKTDLNGVKLVYYSAEETTISTSAEEITLLKGNNVLSTNADNMELKYSVSLDSLLTT